MRINEIPKTKKKESESSEGVAAKKQTKKEENKSCSFSIEVKEKNPIDKAVGALNIPMFRLEFFFFFVFFC